MRKIFIVEFSPTPPRTSGFENVEFSPPPRQAPGLIYGRMECVNCGRDMIDKHGTLSDVGRHVCAIDKHTDWRTVARDAFLEDRDAEAIAIIAEMDPDRLHANVELRDALAETRNALAEAIAQIEQHNSKYQHRTPPFEIERWKKNLK